MFFTLKDLSTSEYPDLNFLTLNAIQLVDTHCNMMQEGSNANNQLGFVGFICLVLVLPLVAFLAILSAVYWYCHKRRRAAEN